MKLINADTLREEFCRDIMGGLNWDRILREAKAVDAVPVVRCMDCKHYQFEGAFGMPVKMCERFEFGGDIDDDDFCSWAERRENDKR